MNLKQVLLIFVIVCVGLPVWNASALPNIPDISHPVLDNTLKVDKITTPYYSSHLAPSTGTQKISPALKSTGVSPSDINTLATSSLKEIKIYVNGEKIGESDMNEQTWPNPIPVKINDEIEIKVKATASSNGPATLYIQVPSAASLEYSYTIPASQTQTKSATSTVDWSSGSKSFDTRIVDYSGSQHRFTGDKSFKISSLPRPTVISIDPSSAPNSSSIPVTITGTDFQDNADVFLLASPYIQGIDVTVASSTKITCELPITGAKAGTYILLVQNPDGQDGWIMQGFTITDSGILPDDDTAKLTYALNVISNEGWNQSAVDIANSILMSGSHDSTYYSIFFTNYFRNNRFNDNVCGYLVYPVLTWSSESIQNDLQQGMLNALQTIISEKTETNKADLKSAFKNNPTLFTTLLTSQKFICEISLDDNIDVNTRNNLFNFYSSHINTYQNYFKSGITYDIGSDVEINIYRYQIYCTLIEILPKTDATIASISNIIGLSGQYKSILTTHKCLIIDNNGLDNDQLVFINNYLSSLPSDFHKTGKISFSEFLDPDWKYFGNVKTGPGVNSFGSKLGLYTGNPFPNEVNPAYNCLFVGALAHEINHMVDAYHSDNSQTFVNARKRLLDNAGNERYNYLRGGDGSETSGFTNGWFTSNPQEFFASIANQWFTDSENVLNLGVIRYNNGYHEPINQFLFYADTYSKGSSYTKFYTIDINGIISVRNIPITRDANSHINSITVNNKVYKFSLDSNGDVIGITTTDPIVAPVASFTTNKSTGIAPLTVRFTDTSTGGTLTEWDWNYGDNSAWFNTTESGQKNPEHTYTSAGTYTATLIVKNSAGENAASSTITVKSANVPTAPKITSITPGSGQQGGKATVTITGTNFEKNAAKVTVSGSGVKVGAFKTRSTNKIVVIFTIAKTATTGVRTVTVTNPSSGLKAMKKFTVTAAPKITKITSPSGKQGKTVKVTITGKNYEKGKSTVSISGKGVSVTKYVTRNSDKIVAMVRITSSASATKRTVTVKNPTWGVTAIAATKFTVLKAKGTDTSQVEPGSLIRNGVLNSPVLSSSSSTSSPKSQYKLISGLNQVTMPNNIINFT